MTITDTERRAAQQRALAVLAELLADPGMPPLRWTIQPRAVLIGDVPEHNPVPGRAIWDAWRARVGADLLWPEFGGTPGGAYRRLHAKSQQYLGVVIVIRADLAEEEMPA